jgi:hypothetical protein
MPAPVWESLLWVRSLALDSPLGCHTELLQESYQTSVVDKQLRANSTKVRYQYPLAGSDF